VVSRRLSSKQHWDKRTEGDQQTQEMNVPWVNATSISSQQKQIIKGLEVASRQNTRIKTDWDNVSGMKFETPGSSRVQPGTPPSSGETSEASDTENPNLNEVDEFYETVFEVLPKVYGGKRVSRCSKFHERTVTGAKFNPNTSRSARRSPWVGRRVGNSSKNDNRRSDRVRQAEKHPAAAGGLRRNYNMRNGGPEALKKSFKGERQAQIPPYRNFQGRRFTDRRQMPNLNRRQKDIIPKHQQAQSFPRGGRKPPSDEMIKSSANIVGRGSGRRKQTCDSLPAKEKLAVTSGESKLIDPSQGPKAKGVQLPNDEQRARQLSQDEELARQIQREELIARFEELHIASNFDPSHLADICMIPADQMMVPTCPENQDQKELSTEAGIKQEDKRFSKRNQ